MVKTNCRMQLQWWCASIVLNETKFHIPHIIEKNVRMIKNSPYSCSLFYCSWNSLSREYFLSLACFSYVYIFFCCKSCSIFLFCSSKFYYVAFFSSLTSFIDVEPIVSPRANFSCLCSSLSLRFSRCISAAVGVPDFSVELASPYFIF